MDILYPFLLSESASHISFDGMENVAQSCNGARPVRDRECLLPVVYVNDYYLCCSKSHGKNHTIRILVLTGLTQNFFWVKIVFDGVCAHRSAW